MSKDDDEIVSNAYEFVAMGNRQYKLGELEGAQQSYIKAVDILRTASLWVVEYSDVVEDLGDINRELGHYDNAIACYKDAWGDDHLKIGHVYYEDLKDYIKASEIYLDLLFVSDSAFNSSAAFNLANMAWKGEGQQQSLINALLWMQVAHLMNPKSDEFLNAMGKLRNEMNAQDIESALLLFNDYIKKRSEDMEELKRNDPWRNVSM